ncbi:hypothetical protein GGF47_001389 [Coemansia sp. RSA 2524]|nr:hypothetical protein GGF47_001389 [Coemansia sp. RSA 2524]
MSNSSRKRTMHDDSDYTTSTRSKAHKAPKQQSLGAFFSTKKGKTSETMTDDVQWREIGNTWIGKWGSPTAASKFAAFDLDFTLVNVAGKGRFPRNSDDWRFFHPDIPQVLRKMHQQGYRIVILSNQNGLQPGKKDVGLSKKATEYRLKISKIAKQLDVPFTILAAIAKDHMRKPSPGMWHLARMENEGVDVDVENSFFVGDAAGRPAGWKSGVAADFSDSDLAFALNVGVPFYTPEEVFTAELCAKEEPLPLPAPQMWPISRFAPKSLALNREAHTGLIESIAQHTRTAKEANRGLVVMLVGPPACGKSTFARTHLVPLGFERINMDELATRKKCHDAVRQTLKLNGNVVIDNTNPDASARTPFINIANENGATCVAIVFEHATRDLAMHNNNFRAQLVQARYFADKSDGSSLQKRLLNVPECGGRVPEVAYHSFFKRMEAPGTLEGFAEVLYHSFVPEFESADDELLWNRYY